MNRRIVTLLAIGGAGAMAFAVPGIAGNEFKNKYDNTSASQDCDGDTVTYNGPLKMWPPNHKMQDVSVTAADSDGRGPVTITITPSVTDVAGGDGGPNHDPDYTPEEPTGSGDGSATADFQLRSERSGKGDGRTYTIDWVATFDDKECSSVDEGNSPFTVTVPHDMRPSRR
ncbi:MAG TPA: hypothetical protein VM938_05220 [Acidimicrobiales bacterium]|nr:hypothetical protein [Acidimicrobiales bacterium]